jgi:hypothetical protein
MCYIKPIHIAVVLHNLSLIVEALVFRKLVLLPSSGISMKHALLCPVDGNNS